VSESISLAPRGPLRGAFRVPGDKSISHRALLFAALAEGESRLEGLAPGEDVRSTRRVLEALGVPIEDEGDALRVTGSGWEAIGRDPSREVLELDCGNSGTTARLVFGLLAGRPGRFVLKGDESLSKRPMRRVTDPLRAMGARIQEGHTLPLAVEGGPLRAKDYHSPVASAQIKSALVLAALQAEGESVISEPRLSRDHTERMLGAMGATIERVGRARLRVRGGRLALRARDLAVPGDPSSAAFALALSCLLPGSAVEVEGVSVNPTRTGFYRLLQRMGAAIEIDASPGEGEEGRTIAGRAAPLIGLSVDESDVVDAIDEIPLLAVVATQAEGRSTIRGAGELRVKESDRIAATARLLRAFGASVDELEDGLVIEGPTRLRGAEVDAEHDHRIAMCAAVCAAIAQGESLLTGAEWVRVSYPGFFDDLDRLEKRGTG
jgi:3-phosphoshikimate 1-carboxyvinyltransferase